MLKVLAAVVLLLAVAHAAVPGDLITSMPGFNGTLPSKQYSGYIAIPGTQKKFHYWLVLSENDPDTDPLVLWLNGGPGCSSLDGYFYEQGPLHFKAQAGASADEVPELELNPYRWNLNANMLFLESPIGVGFSYSGNPNDYSMNDNSTALDNRAALVYFYKAFPEFASHPFYITGESYAGIYVPSLAYAIHESNLAGQTNIPLKGFLVGNGCFGNSVGSCSQQGTGISIDFLYGHGLYSQALHAQIKSACPDPSNPSGECEELLFEMSNEVGNINIYNILWPCINGGGRVTEEERSEGVRGPRIPERTIDRVLMPMGPNGCIDGILASRYLNNDAVRSAIHVQSVEEGGRWSICTNKIQYSSNIESLLDGYPELIENYRVIVYNGQLDACVPYNGVEADLTMMTQAHNISVTKSWHQWTTTTQEFGTQNAGYAITYDLNNFQFVTFKKPGHMVPEWDPPNALVFFQRYLKGDVF